MRTLLTTLLKFSSALVAMMTLLSYLSPYINPSLFPYVAFFGTAFPWLLLSNVALLLLWAWHRHRFALYHIGILVAGWPYITGFFGLRFAPNQVQENAVSIATHNLGALWRDQKVTDELREKTADAYAQFLKENGAPDILCTQETSGAFYRLLAAKLGYEHTFNLKKGTVILSKFPMEAGGDIPFGKTANSTLWVDLRIHDRIVRVYNVHLQSNRVTNDTEKVLEEAELENEATWHDIRTVLAKVGRATRLRAEQAQRLREHLEACKYPAIVCGDFNDTPNSYVYRLLSRDLTDTFREKGVGRGTTFAGVLPMLRIDYVLTDPAFHTFSCRTVRGHFSDHYPVFVDIGMP